MHFQKNQYLDRSIIMSYLEAGEGETLLFIHGWGIRARTYKNALTILAGKYRVLAPDLPGFGDSSLPPKTFGFSDYANFLTRFIQESKLKNITLMGHSTGGGIALYLAAENREVKKLILVDAADMPVEYNRLKLYSIYAKQVVEEYVKPENLKMTLTTLRDYLSNTKHLKHLLPFTYKITDRSIAANPAIFDKVQIPTVIFWGKRDLVLTGELAKRIQQRIPQSNLVFVEGTHDWILFSSEQLRKFMSLI